MKATSFGYTVACIILGSIMFAGDIVTENLSVQSSVLLSTSMILFAIGDGISEILKKMDSK